jgi:hypothetical protein
VFFKYVGGEEQINITYAGMSGMQTDWFAIYIYGSSNAWGNIVDNNWNWTKGNSDGTAEGSITLNALPVGNYEIRGFFKTLLLMLQLILLLFN